MQISFHGWKTGWNLITFGIFFFPSCCNCFHLCIEFRSSFSIKIQITVEWFFASCERKHWERDWDGQIYSDLCSFNFTLELSSGRTISSKNSSTISVLISKNYILLENKIKKYLFVRSIASYKVFAFITHKTGPKISSL